MNIKTRLIKGYGVASGNAEDPRFMQGTIAMQKPYFKQLGLDLTPYYNGTLNVSIAPHMVTIIKPDHQFKNILWCAGVPAEDFSFVQCTIIVKGIPYQGLVYHPDANTKTQHMQSKSTLEVLSVYIANVEYGDELELVIDDDKINFRQ